MGLYDNVKPPRTVMCPGCGQALNGWQSKDDECALNTITDLRKIDVFYTTCLRCDVWVQFTRRVERKDELADFDMAYGDPWSGMTTAEPTFAPAAAPREPGDTDG